MPGGAVRVLLLGPVPYSLALRVQERCVGAARAAALGAAAAAAPPHRNPPSSRPPAPAPPLWPAESLVLSEPAEPVYAWGLRGAPGVSLAAKLREKGAGLAAVRRGGHVTYHGPGQLLALVVLDLRARRGALRALHHLPRAGAELLHRPGLVRAHRPLRAGRDGGDLAEPRAGPPRPRSRCPTTLPPLLPGGFRLRLGLFG